MKKTLYATAIFSLITLFSFAQGARFEFKDKNDTYEFGTIKEGEKTTHDFVFTNTGNQPLQILKAEAGCSCTSADWPKIPVMPGKTGVIKVTFNSEGKPGPTLREITIKSNAVLPDPKKERYTIYLKGNVKGK